MRTAQVVPWVPAGHMQEQDRYKQGRRRRGRLEGDMQNPGEVAARQGRPHARKPPQHTVCPVAKAPRVFRSRAYATKADPKAAAAPAPSAVGPVRSRAPESLQTKLAAQRPRTRRPLRTRPPGSRKGRQAAGRPTAQRPRHGACSGQARSLTPWAHALTPCARARPHPQPHRADQSAACPRAPGPRRAGRPGRPPLPLQRRAPRPRRARRPAPHASPAPRLGPALAARPPRGLAAPRSPPLPPCVALQVSSCHAPPHAQGPARLETSHNRAAHYPYSYTS